jgi:hypothetical protein
MYRLVYRSLETKMFRNRLFNVLAITALVVVAALTVQLAVATPDTASEAARYLDQAERHAEVAPAASYLDQHERRSSPNVLGSPADYLDQAERHAGLDTQSVPLDQHDRHP